ncbi:MAG: GGDEF domain-containing protein [Oscillospiraceae bacterium]
MRFWGVRGILLGNLGQLAGLLVTALYVAILYAGRNYFNRYAQLLEVQKAGWTEMMVSSMLIYAALIFFAAYPRPLVTRLEYAPVYLLFCAVVLSCYLVFVHSIVKTKKIYDQYQLLQREQELYRIAYTDALTGLENRAAYFERIRELQGEFSNLENLCCIVFDINNFKSINDTLGHAVGDRVLCLVAQLLRDTFEQGGVFRMGGDEFFALLTNCEELLIRKKLQSLEEQLEKESLDVGMPVYLAAGYDIVKILPRQAQSPGDIIEQAFDRADRNMYRDKAAHKVCPVETAPAKKD